MRDSGQAWLGLIPLPWRLSRIGSLYSLRNEKVSDKDYPPLSVTMKGIVPQLDSAAKTDDGDNRKLVRVGDFAINSRSDRRGSCGISAYNGSVSLINTVLTPREKMNMHPGYYNWLFHTVAFADEFYKWGHGIVDDLWTTRWQEMKRIVVPVPPLDEQQAIAAFLDDRVSQIDSIIEVAKYSIEEYKQWKAAIIFETVTKGVNPTCDFRKTNIKWLPEIPTTSSIIRLKTVIDYIESGTSVNAGLDPAIEGEFGVLKTSAVSKNRFIPSENKSVNAEEYGRVSCPVKGNTLIVSRMNTPDLVGACGYVEKDYDNLFLPDRLWQVHIRKGYEVKYIWYFLVSNFVRNYYASLATGTSSSMQNISQGQFGNLPIVIHPEEVQRIIVDFLDDKCANIELMIEEKEGLIEDLESYKRSLIYEIVTGKRKVV